MSDLFRMPVHESSLLRDTAVFVDPDTMNQLAKLTDRVTEKPSRPVRWFLWRLLLIVRFLIRLAFTPLRLVVRLVSSPWRVRRLRRDLFWQAEMSNQEIGRLYTRFDEVAELLKEGAELAKKLRNERDFIEGKRYRAASQLEETKRLLEEREQECDEYDSDIEQLINLLSIKQAAIKMWQDKFQQLEKSIEDAKAPEEESNSAKVWREECIKLSSQCREQKAEIDKLLFTEEVKGEPSDGEDIAECAINIIRSLDDIANDERKTCDNALEVNRDLQRRYREAIDERDKLKRQVEQIGQFDVERLYEIISEQALEVLKLRGGEDAGEKLKRWRVALDNCRHYAEQAMESAESDYMQLANIIREVDDAFQERKAA